MTCCYALGADRSVACSLLAQGSGASLSLLEEAGDLSEAQKRWEAAKLTTAKIQQQLNDKREHSGAVKVKLERARSNQKRAREIAGAGIAAAVQARLISRVGELVDEQLETLVEIESEHRNAIEHALNEVRNQFETQAAKR